jgi:hypothetical protein
MSSMNASVLPATFSASATAASLADPGQEKNAPIMAPEI